jgi:hypothetical protein
MLAPRSRAHTIAWFLRANRHVAAFAVNQKLPSLSSGSEKVLLPGSQKTRFQS